MVFDSPFIPVFFTTASVLINSTLNAANTAGNLLLDLAKILAILIIFLLLYLIARETFRKENGLIILPFDAFSGNAKENFGGKAISDLLRYELQRISDIHNRKLSPISINIDLECPKKGSLEDGSNNKKKTKEYRVSLPSLVSQGETLEYSLSEIGSVKAGVFELSLGQIIVAIKKHLSDKYRHDVISGSLQMYGSDISIIACYEGSEFRTWEMMQKKFKGNEGDDEYNIPQMVRDLAYKITHYLSIKGASITELAQNGDESKSVSSIGKASLSSEPCEEEKCKDLMLDDDKDQDAKALANSWMTWKYFSEALDAYYQYTMKNDMKVLEIARENCIAAIELEGSYYKPVELYSQLGLIYVNEGKKTLDYNVAWDIFYRLKEIKPELAFFGLGLLHFFSKEYRDAINYFDNSIDVNYNTAQSWLFKGLCYQYLQSNEEATKALDKAIEIAPQYALAWYLKGLNLHRNFPDFASECAASKDHSLYRSHIRDESGRYDKAMEAYRKAMENPKYEQYDQAWFNIGSLLADLGRHGEALEAYDKAIKINPQYANALHQKGIILSELGRHEEALEALDKAIWANEKVPWTYYVTDPAYCWFYKGVSFDKLGKHREAIEAYEKAIEINSSFVEAWRQKGISLMSAGLYSESTNEEILDAFSKAGVKESPYPSSLKLKAFYLNQKARYNDAIVEIEAAIQSPPEDDVLLDIRGIALAGLGRFEDALECFDAAIKLCPQNAGTWNRKYLSLKALGRKKDAEAFFVKMEEIGYARPILLKIHFKNIFSKGEQRLATIDSIWQASESNPQEVIVNLLEDIIVSTGYIDLTGILTGNYSLCIGSIDIEANKISLELEKDGKIVHWSIITPFEIIDSIVSDSAMTAITTPQEIDSTFEYPPIRTGEQILEGPDAFRVG